MEINEEKLKNIIKKSYQEGAINAHPFEDSESYQYFQKLIFENKKSTLWDFNSFEKGMKLMSGSVEYKEAKKRRKGMAKEIISLLNITNDDTVLDLGSGMGLIAKEIAMKVKEIYCMDISKSFLKIAEQECGQLQNIHFKFITADTFKHFKNYFTKIYSTGVFIHLNLYQIYEYFKIFKDALKKAGLVYIDIYDTDHLIENIERFLGMAHHYHIGKAYKHFEPFTVWNDTKAVVFLAEYNGLSLINRKNKTLIFQKN